MQAVEPSEAKVGSIQPRALVALAVTHFQGHRRDRLRGGKGHSWGNPTAVTFHVKFPLKGNSRGKQSNLQIPGLGGLDSGTGGDVNAF